jgi:hypothetical protein
MLSQPNDIGSNRRTGKAQIGIIPFMEFAMTVSKRKGTRIAMVDRRTIVDKRAVGRIFKITVIQ